MNTKQQLDAILERITKLESSSKGARVQTTGELDGKIVIATVDLLATGETTISISFDGYIMFRSRSSASLRDFYKNLRSKTVQQGLDEHAAEQESKIEAFKAAIGGGEKWNPKKHLL